MLSHPLGGRGVAVGVFRACRSSIVGLGRARLQFSQALVAPALVASAPVARAALRSRLFSALVAPALVPLAVLFHLRLAVLLRLSRFLQALVASALLAVRAVRLAAPRPLLLACRPVQASIHSLSRPSLRRMLVD